MRPLVLLLAPLCLAASQPVAPSVTCKVGVIYPADRPWEVSLQVPDKRCDVEGMRQALGKMLLLLSQ